MFFFSLSCAGEKNEQIFSGKTSFDVFDILAISIQNESYYSSAITNTVLLALLGNWVELRQLVPIQFLFQV